MLKDNSYTTHKFGRFGANIILLKYEKEVEITVFMIDAFKIFCKQKNCLADPEEENIIIGESFEINIRLNNELLCESRY